MSFYHTDENNHVRDKYDGYKDAAEVTKAVVAGILKRFDNDKFVYDVKTGKEFWADGTPRK